MVRFTLEQIMEEQRAKDSFFNLVTSALDGVDVQGHALTPLPPGNYAVPIV